MSVSITDGAIRQITLAALVTAILCIPDRANAMGDPTGACCIPFDICEVTTIQECFGELGGVIWAPGQDCGTFTCPPLGACCKPDGTCQITGQSFCENTFDGTYQGDGVTCQDVTCTQSCPADLTGDGEVGILDLLVLLTVWGSDGPLGDIDEDGTVAILDLLTLVASWGPCA